MKDFDYNINKVIGYVDITHTGNANVEVVGYRDLRNEFYKLTEVEAEGLFPPKGKIFAHNFANKYGGLQGKLACISIKPSDRDRENYDYYVWDKAEEVYEFCRRVHSLQGYLNENGENNFQVFIDNELIETEEEKFVCSEGRVYHIKANSRERIIHFWKQERLDIIQVQGKKFLVGFSFPPYDGAIDITTDDQLVDWYLGKILKKKWQEILKEQNFKFIEPYLKEILSAIKDIDSSILKNRMERLCSINMNLFLTLEELQHISESPWLSQSIDKTIEKHKKEFLTSIASDYKKKLTELEEEHQLLIEEENNRFEQEINALGEKMKIRQEELNEEEKKLISAIDEKRLDLGIVEEDIEHKNELIHKLEKRIDMIEERKAAIVEDFSVVKEVMETILPVQQVMKQNVTFSLEEIHLALEETMMYQGFKKSLETTFIKNHLNHNGVSTIGDQIAMYNMLLVPDVTIAKAIVVSALNCAYMTTYVSVQWKSFDDLWENGLGYILQQSKENPERMYFLILQNINLSYLPNYMQPLVDLQSGVISKLPKYGLAFPDNLRIICTLTEEEVLPLSTKCLKYIGCVDPSSLKKDFYSRIELPTETKWGFLSPKRLQEAQKEIKDVSNFYKEYINE